jgi:dolichyl-phosphate-mannose-protein mannosyltransferase
VSCLPPEPRPVPYHPSVRSPTTQIETRTADDLATSRTFAFLRWINNPIVAIVAVALIAGALRFVNLGYPKTRVFDEIYYSKSACIFLGYSNQRCDVTSEDEKFWRTDKNDTGAWVHPPLGKWAIALGELAVGTDSLGWRVSSAVAGTATVVILAVMIQLLLGSPLWTFVGGLLLATESLSFVQSRVAMLDIFVAFWVALGFLFILLDRRWIERRAPQPVGADRPRGEATVAPVEMPLAARVPSPLVRPWRIAAGVAFGAAIASKWSGIAAILGALILSFMWEAVRRKRAGMTHPIWSTVQWESFPLVLFLLFVPALVYVASYLGWFLHFGFHVGKWLRLQQDMASYHWHLQGVDPQTHKPIHPYLSQAWKWILMWRPVLYYAKYGENVRRVIYSDGNPAIFWGSIIAIPYVAYAWWLRRDWRAGFVTVSAVSLYLPWFLVSRPQFIFYATPIVPFFVLACVYTLKDLSEAHISGSRSRPWLPVAVGFVVLSVGLFAWFWPVLTGGPLSGPAFSLRAWFPSWV